MKTSQKPSKTTKLSFTAIRNFLRYLQFNPKTSELMKIVVENATQEYLEIRIIELMHEAKKLRDLEESETDDAQRLGYNVDRHKTLQKAGKLLAVLGVYCERSSTETARKQ
jgi:hypothetical protein